MSYSTENQTLCRCLGISESEVRAATDFAGCQSLCDIKRVTSAGTGCMACHARIKSILAEETAPAAVPNANGSV